METLVAPFQFEKIRLILCFRKRSLLHCSCENFSTSTRLENVFVRSFFWKTFACNSASPENF